MKKVYGAISIDFDSVDSETRTVEATVTVALPAVEHDWREGDRVYDRRSDLFGTITELVGLDHAMIKYEWPMSPTADPFKVSVDRLERSS